MDFLNIFSRRSQIKGYNYFLQGKVTELSLERNYLTASVEGSETNTYFVKIDLNRPRNSVCNCPYAVKGKMCKHMVAAYFAAFPNEVEEFDDTEEEDYDDYEEEYRRHYYYYDEYDDEYEEDIVVKEPFIKPLFYDDLLDDFIKSLSINKLRNILTNELKKNEESTYFNYLENHFKNIKNIDNNNPKYLLEELNYVIAKNCRNEFCTDDFQTFSLTEKEMISAIYQSNDFYRTKLENLLLSDNLCCHSAFSFVLDFYLSKLEKTKIIKLKELLTEKLNDLKKWSISTNLSKSNVLIYLYRINKYLNEVTIETIVESLRKNAKYKEYLQYVVLDYEDTMLLYDKYLKIIEKHSFDKGELVSLLKMIAKKTKDNNAYKSYYFYSVLYNENIQFLDNLKQYDDYNSIISKLITKCKKDYLLEKIYLKLDMRKELFELYFNKNVDYKLVAHAKYLAVQYKKELVEYFKTRFIKNVDFASKRDEYKATCEYIYAINLCNDYKTINYLRNYIFTKYPKKTALHEEFELSLIRKY